MNHQQPAPGSPLPAPAHRASTVLIALSLLYFAIHAAYLAPSLEDLDSVNFALAIEDFDPAAHRPHPPGYPVFVALAKLSSLVVASEARALAVWSALLGALSIFPLVWLFGCLDRMGGQEGSAPSPIVTSLLALCCPVVWFMAVRPMSDIAGMFVALVAQATLAAALVRQRRARAARAAPTAGFVTDWSASGRLIVVGAFLAALAIGVRSQAAWLTLPLLALVLLDRLGDDFAGAALGSAMSFTIGFALWLVPALVASGGPQRYWQALLMVGRDDVAGLELLATRFSTRLATLGVWRTFVDPWGEPALGFAVIASAVLGAAASLAKRRAALVLLATLCVPYALFHILVQDTINVRYTLPLIPAVVYLAGRGLRTVAGRWANASILGLAGVAVAVGHPTVRAYGSAPSPAARLMADLDRASAAQGSHAPPVAMHHVFMRTVEARGAGFSRIVAPPRREWLELVTYWRSGKAEPIWFLADPKRTDLALVDPAARRLLAAYRWPPQLRPTLLGDTRPSEADWYEIRRPGWFAGEGFSLTPETAGVSAAMGRGPSHGPISAWVRRRSTDATLMIGGRHLGSAGDGPARLRATLDDRELLAWEVEPGTFFLRMATMPAGAFPGAGHYAVLRIAASGAGGRPPPPASIEQFDVQDAGQVVYGFGAGWHEPEYNPLTGARWRWTSDRALVEIRHGGQDLVMVVAGESPLVYFDAPPHVAVRIGDRTITEFDPSGDFEWRVPIPRALAGGESVSVAIETDRVFVPAERSWLRRSHDRRRLGLRIYRVEVRGR